MDKTTVNKIVVSLRSALESNGISVDSIAIFGSAHKGGMTADSDLDLIIVSNDFEGKDIFDRASLTMAAERAIMKQFVIPMDILNLTPQEYNERKAVGFFESKIVV